MSTEIKTLSKLLTVQDVMKILQISQSSVYRMVDTRVIACYKIRSGLRFSEEDILKYLEETKIKPIHQLIN